MLALGSFRGAHFGEATTHLLGDGDGWPSSSDSPEEDSSDEQVRPGTRYFVRDLALGPSGPVPRLRRRLGSSSACLNLLEAAPEPLRVEAIGAMVDAAGTPCVGVPSGEKGTHGGWKASCRTKSGSEAAFKASAQSATAAHSAAFRGKLITRLGALNSPTPAVAD